MRNVAAMIGGGLIGRSWAMVFARAGWRVRIFDSVASQLDVARGEIERGLAEQQRYGLTDDATAAAARVEYIADLEQALAGVDWVQENAPEVLDVKRELYPRIDRATPSSAIIASSTSAIPASRFTERLAGRARCLVAHPVNPPHLVPVVELCGAPWTDAATVERARAVMTGIGQVPITVTRELDGFILNRLQGALLSEALRLVGEGYVSPDDLDKTVQDGLGLRWSFIGPFATIELNAPGGVADYCARYAGFYRTLAAEPPAPAVWDAGNVAKVTSQLPPTGTAAERDARMRWRDTRLLALRQHKRATPDSD
ncbi:MAG: 3-hydroxyacyl-CoA dehydrogenase [Betaproteobacteria bacterium]